MRKLLHYTAQAIKAVAEFPLPPHIVSMVLAVNMSAACWWKLDLQINASGVPFELNAPADRWNNRGRYGVAAHQ
jgi:hypothetical protein